MRKRLIVFMAVLATLAFGLAPAQAAHELQLRLRLPLDSAQFVYSQFSFPTAMAVNAQGQLFVADPDKNCIQKFDSNGRLSHRLGQ